jgi:hypothetical protein
MKKFLALLVASMLSTCSFAPAPAYAGKKYPLDAEIRIELCQVGVQNNGKVVIVKGSDADKQAKAELKNFQCVETHDFNRKAIIADEDQLAIANNDCDRIGQTLIDQFPASYTVLTCIFE